MTTYNYQTDFKKIEDLENLYQKLECNKVGLSVEELKNMVMGSWFSLYVYDGLALIGTGRIISDGIITGLICGVGVLPSFQNQGIGKEIVTRLIQECEKHKVYPQLM